MVKLYYIESKHYYYDAQKIEHQIADGGDMPILYTNKKKAIKRAQAMEKFYNETYGYTTIIPNNENPAKKDNCIFAVRLMNENTGIRHELRVYEINTL